MARCGCASDQCSCFIVAGQNVAVSGSGTQADPYVVSAVTPTVDPGGAPVGSSDPHFIGEIIEYASASPPSADYLACDGSEVSRAVYNTLFSRLGTTHGAGNGSTTFNLPNKAGKFTLGPDGSHARGSTGGAETVALTATNLPPHTHAIDHDHPLTDVAGDHDHTLSRSDSTGGNHGNIPDGQATTAASSRAAIANDGAHQHEIPPFTGTSGNGPGSSAPVDKMPPYVTIPFYIRVQGGP